MVGRILVVFGGPGFCWFMGELTWLAGGLIFLHPTWLLELSIPHLPTLCATAPQSYAAAASQGEAAKAARDQLSTLLASKVGRPAASSSYALPHDLHMPRWVASWQRWSINCIFTQACFTRFPVQAEVEGKLAALEAEMAAAASVTPADVARMEAELAALNQQVGWWLVVPAPCALAFA